MRALPPAAAKLKKPVRAAAAAGKGLKAGAARPQAAAPAAQTLSIQKAVAAAASAIMGTEVRSLLFPLFSSGFAPATEAQEA